MKISALVTCLVVILTLTGCDKIPFLGGGDEEAAPTTAPTAPPPPPVPGSGPAAVPAAPVPAAPVAAVPAPTAPVAFQWTETPSFNLIPATPVSGNVNDKPFQALNILFEPGVEGWNMVVGDTALANPTDEIVEGQRLVVELPDVPAAGKLWMLPMEDGHGYFQLVTDPADPKITTQWKSQNSIAIEITKWEVAAYEEGQDAKVAGKASGKVAVCYKESAGYTNSWIAGTFTDVPVRYMGKAVVQKEEPADEKPRRGGSGGKKYSAADAQKAIDAAGGKDAVIDKAKKEAEKKGIKLRPVKIIKLDSAKEKTE